MTQPRSTDGSPEPANPDDSGRSLSGAVRTFSGLTLVSRVAGLARDLATVRVFADTAVGSAFAAAFAIPNLFRRLLGEGALAAAFLPEYARSNQSNPEAADRLGAWTLRSLGMLSSGIVAIAEVFLLALLIVLPANPDRALSLRLVMVMLPLMPTVCVTAILGAMLQVHGRFAPSAAAPIILNLLMIGAAMLHFVGPRLDPIASAYAIGVAAFVACVLQVVWCMRALGPRFSWKRCAPPPEARRVLRRFGPVALGLGTVQLNALLDTAIAMWPSWVGPTVLGAPYPLDTASNAILSYTQRLYQFPLGVFGIAVATAAFPALSRNAGSPARFANSLRAALRLALFIAIPASAGLALVRHEAVAVMFGGPSGFSLDGLGRSAQVLLGYGVAIWAYSLNHVLVRAFYALGDTRTPVRVAVACVILNLALNLTLVWWIQEAGLAWSTAISAVVQTGLLATILSRQVEGALFDARTRHFCVAVMLSIVVMAIPVWFTLRLMTPGAAWTDHAYRLAAATGAGLLAYAVASRVLGIPEFTSLLHVRRGR
ncbi:MAG: murein biosynthesis integral membrane protein MurJ [Phycisphaeraceae bacterium]|nr:murein biosynthesis integral membrane protein MurJ [Phycisphaeraceae bacterium]